MLIKAPTIHRGQIFMHLHSRSLLTDLILTIEIYFFLRRITHIMIAHVSTIYKVSVTFHSTFLNMKN